LKCFGCELGSSAATRESSSLVERFRVATRSSSSDPYHLSCFSPRHGGDEGGRARLCPEAAAEPPGTAVRRELKESAVRRERYHLEEQLRHAQKLESLGLPGRGWRTISITCSPASWVMPASPWIGIAGVRRSCDAAGRGEGGRASRGSHSPAAGYAAKANSSSKGGRFVAGARYQ